jgi:hypothetical protein
MINGYNEFLITMRTSEGHDDLLMCDVDTIEEAIDYAFGTRNIASSWEIANIESDDVEILTTFPVTFEQWTHWHKFVKLVMRP